MDINLTLVIQSVNFFIAYGIIRKFLLEPAVQVIKKEQAQQEKLNVVIRQQEEHMVLRGNERQKYWQACREYFRDHRPFIEQSSLLIKELPEISLPTVPAKLIDQLIKETQDALVKKIGRINVPRNSNFYF